MVIRNKLLIITILYLFINTKTDGLQIDYQIQNNKILQSNFKGKGESDNDQILETQNSEKSENQNHLLNPNIESIPLKFNENVIKQWPIKNKKKIVRKINLNKQEVLWIRKVFTNKEMDYKPNVKILPHSLKLEDRSKWMQKY